MIHYSTKYFEIVKDIKMTFHGGPVLLCVLYNIQNIKMIKL